jgi:hypothetical protein
VNVDPDDIFYADAAGFDTDLEGTLSVTVLNPDGTTYRAAQTDRIREQVAGTGCYRAVIAGLPRGHYALKWDDGAGGVAFETVFVREPETAGDHHL